MTDYTIAGLQSLRGQQTRVLDPVQSHKLKVGGLASYFRLMVVACALATVCPAPAQLVSVTTEHNDNSRRGLNDKETILPHANVNPVQFGKVFSQSIDGYSYAQPLYLPSVNIQGLGVHNVVYVATEHDTIYAFDADSNQGINKLPLWQRSLIDPVHGVTRLTPKRKPPAPISFPRSASRERL